MKIKFDAQKLVSLISLVKAALPNVKGTPTEENIGIRAADNQLTIYAYTKGQWVRIVIPGEVEKEGTIFVNRQRLFNLLGVLKGEIKLQLVGTQAKFTTTEQAGKFSMITSTTITPKPAPQGEQSKVVVEAAPLLKQLQACTLDEDLVGGGFGASFGQTLEIISSDRVRLIAISQKYFITGGSKFTIPSESIKGVTALLKIAGGGTVNIWPSPNITSWHAKNENGSFEYGSTNISMAFPDVKKITEATGYTNHAMFEVGDLLEAMKRVTVLADHELAWGDFDFSNPETCVITTEAVDGASEVIVDTGTSEIEDEKMEVIRLQLNHVKSFMSKAAAQGIEYIHMKWGSGLPVKFIPDAQEEPTMDIKFICAALNRPVVKEAKA